MNIETKMGVVKDGKTIIPFEFDHIEPAIVDGKESDVLFKFEKNENQGILRYNTYDGSYSYTTADIAFIGDFEDDVAIIALVPDEGTAIYTLIDTNLNIKQDLKYFHISRIGRGYYRASKLISTDIINGAGAVLFENVISATLNDQKSDNVYIAQKDELFALIKVDGDTIYETDYDFTSIDEFHDGVSIVTEQHDFTLKYGLLDTNFNELLEPIYSEITMFDSDLYIIRDKLKYGVYSVSKKQMIIPVNFKSVSIVSSSGDKKTKISVEI